MRNLRLQRGLTQEQLALKARVSQVYICRIENGYVDGVSIRVIKKLGKALDICPTELFSIIIRCELKYKGKCIRRKWE